jgi:hypothetical protein
VPAIDRMPTTRPSFSVVAIESSEMVTGSIIYLLLPSLSAPYDRHAANTTTLLNSIGNSAVPSCSLPIK